MTRPRETSLRERVEQGLSDRVVMTRRYAVTGVSTAQVLYDWHE